MASREEVYCKFGMAAEAGQLFETELGTLLLGAHGLDRSWHLTPEPIEGQQFLSKIESHTLGRLFGHVRKYVTFDDLSETIFNEAVKTRNKLVHGFFERHNFRIDSDEGRDLMLEDLEQIHQCLFDAWQAASGVTRSVGDYLFAQQGKRRE